MLSQMRKGLNELLHDVVTLEVALSRKTEAHVLVRARLFAASRYRCELTTSVQALLLPQYWSSFIRSGSMDDVRPLGLGATPPPSP